MQSEMRVPLFIRSRHYRWYILAGVITALVSFALISRVVEALPAATPPVAVYPLPASGSSFTYTNPNGGDLTVTATLIYPTAGQGQLCAGNRQRPNFSYNLSDTGILLGPTTSTLTYDLDLGWRDCNRATLKYAIYSPVYCRLAGHYGAGAQGNAFDCVKYIHNASNNDALGCAIGGPATPANGGGAPTFNPCVEPWFTQGGIGIPKARYGPDSGTPSALGQVKSFNDLSLPQVGVMGLGMNTNSNGSRDFSSTMCQYWVYNDDLNTGSDTVSGDDDCKDIHFNISWTYTPPPSYDLSATVTDPGDTFTYYTDAPTTWGARLNSYANLRNASVGNHAVDLWRLVFPPGPLPAWAEGTITGDPGLCPSFPGAQSCDRLIAWTCPGGPPQNCGPIPATGPYWAWNYSGAVGPYPVGTNVCYVSRVTRPTYPSNDSQWKGSAMECIMSAKSPRTQFTGSDVRVVGAIRSSYYSVQGNNYGSWVEYGAFSSDVNMLLGSGAGLRNGSPNPASSWNGLTFANRNAPSYGSYNPVPQDSAHSYFSGLIDAGGGLNQANPGTGVYTVGSGTTLSMPNVPNGRSVVIRSAGTIRITGNINVPNTGAANINQLSQVVIVANTILIDEGVTNVDAWLVTPTTVTGNGTIDTCYRGGDTTINSSVCASQLTVNGPIYTRNLKLRRTAGSNPPGVNELKQPAERFNLRPDAQLWAYAYANKGDFAQTDYVQELPPRY